MKKSVCMLLGITSLIACAKPVNNDSFNLDSGLLYASCAPYDGAATEIIFKDIKKENRIIRVMITASTRDVIKNWNISSTGQPNGMSMVICDNVGSQQSKCDFGESGYFDIKKIENKQGMIIYSGELDVNFKNKNITSEFKANYKKQSTPQMCG